MIRYRDSYVFPPLFFPLPFAPKLEMGGKYRIKATESSSKPKPCSPTIPTKLTVWGQGQVLYKKDKHARNIDSSGESEVKSVNVVLEEIKIVPNYNPKPSLYH